MDYKNIFNSFEEKSKKQLDFIKSLSIEERENIKNKEYKISEKIKLMLDNIEFKISDIQTSFRKDFNTKDGEIIDAFYTVFTSTETQRPISIVSNLKEEMLYVKVSINNFISIKEFFNLKKD